MQTVITMSLNAQERITGHVLDSKTGEHLPYATIVIKGTSIGTVADATGHFTILDVPTGKVQVTASLLGYSPNTKNITLEEGTGSIDLEFILTEDVMSLDQVVVSSNRSEVKRKESPTLVSVMPSLLLEQVGAPTLAAGLNFQTGVRVETNCQNCGFTQVRINGLEGSYSQILIDSRATFSALTGVYGLEQIPTNMIDRVEIIRGGGSALFGSSAIGGVINVITKTPEYSSAQFATEMTSIKGGSNDVNTTANATFVTNNQKAGVTIFGQNRQRTASDLGTDGYSEIPEFENKVLGIRTFFKLSDYSKLSLQYDAIRDYRRGGNKLDTPASMLDFMDEEKYALNNDADKNNDVEIKDIAEMISHVINSGGINYDLFSKDYKRKLNIYTSMQDVARESCYNGFGEADDFTIVSGTQFTSSFDHLLFMPSEFIAGLEHNYSSLLDQSFPISKENVAPIDQKVNTYSAFAQNEWRNKKVGVLIGIRADKHSLLDDVVLSPRFNLRYNPSDKFNFRATYSTGFRAPQLFDEDLHIELVGGTQIRHTLAEGLKPEYSQSFNLSADIYQQLGKVSTNLLVEGFYTQLDDAFASRYVADKNGIEIHEKYNSSGAKVYGLTLEARAVVPDIVQFQAGFTIQKSEFEKEQDWSEEGIDPTKSFMRSPNNYGYMTVTLPLANRLNFGASGTYTGEMLVPHFYDGETPILETSNSFFDANLKLDYSFRVCSAVNINIYGSVQNVFDAFQDDFDNNGGARDSGYIYGPALPRRGQLGIKFMF